MISNCPVCGSGARRAVMTVSDVPGFCNVLYDTAEDAAAAPRGDIDLVMCDDCGLLYNASFDEALLAYSPEYENSLHFSPAFQAYAEELADRLVSTYDIRGGQVIEIGPGSGDFLSMVCERGDNVGVGYDPSHDPQRAPDHDRISIEVAPYPTTRSVDAKLVCSRHVLEHLTAPGALVSDIRGSLVEGASPVVYHEVPDATYMLEEVAIWDLIYEHVSYFAEPTLRHLHERAGYDVITAGRSFGDQYLWIDARPGEGTDAGPDLTELVTLAERFSDVANARMGEWEQRTADMVAAGPTVIWGSGSKGVQFLNAVRSARDIVAAVDINPRKHGKFVPGTGQPVVGPDDLVDLGVRSVIVMNPLYRDEIAAQVASLGLEADVVSM